MSLFGHLGRFLGNSVGNVVHSITSNPLKAIATAGGFALGGPVGAGLANTATGLVQGQNVGNALKSGLISGGTAYLGDQAGSAFASQFPETGASLGLSPEAPSAFGNFADMFPSTAQSLGIGQTVGPAIVPAGTSTAVGGTSAPIATTGGVSAAGGAAPSSVSGGGFSLDDLLRSPSMGTAATSAKEAVSPSTLLGSQSLGGARDFLKDNANWLVPGAALGAQAIQGQQALPGQNQLKEQAQQLGLQGEQLQQYLQNGTLPAGLQSGIQQATESAKATIRSQYAARGMSGSSAEQQDLAAVDAQAQQQGAQMALQLLQQGVSETGMSANLYDSMMKSSLSQDEQLGSALANFASSAAGGSGDGKTLKLSLAA